MNPRTARRATGSADSTPKERSGLILMYHRVNDLAVDPHGLCVTQREFREQVRHLADRYPVIPLDRFARGVRNGDLPPRAVAVTLDDGTLDALESASPVLADAGLHATFFINTERLDEEHEPWWDMLAEMFLSSAPVPDALELMMDGSLRVCSTRQEGDRVEAYATIHSWLMDASRPERERVLALLLDWSRSSLRPRRSHRVLLADEIRELADRPGHTIGAHSVSHLDLPRQPAEEQAWEIGASRRQLERITGRPVTLFSYPYGRYDSSVVRQVREAGFRAAVTTRLGTAAPGTDVFALPRLEVKRWDVSRFAGALDAAFGDAEQASPGGDGKLT